MRPDIQRAFDLSTSNGRARLYWWYYVHAFREMWLNFQSSEDLKGPANVPVEHLPVSGPIAVTWLMREFWLQGHVPKAVRPGLTRLGQCIDRMRLLAGAAREPRSSEEQWHLASWYFCVSLHEHNLEGLLTPELAAKLLAAGTGDKSAPVLLKMAHHCAADLHDLYPSSETISWRQWCAGEGLRRFPIFSHPSIRGRLFGGAPTASTPRIFEGEGFGVNLIGHARTRSGVGEDLRMAARALKAAGIPFAVRNVNPSTGVPSEEASLESDMTDHSPFQINIFCMAGMETVTTLAQNRGLRHGKVNVGFWPWELSEWPRLWSHAPGLMDELWASTSFTAGAYRQLGKTPVYLVPMAVDVDATERLERTAFGLPEARFLFGFSFDGHSSFSRKNPEAPINAFLQAFPRGDEPVGLVLKGLRVVDHSEWRKLERLAAADSRIILISASMRRGALLDLYRAIDCFISLHRSEGFGRNIAECMLLGKPVITTNYSGNVDFTRLGTAALVDAEMQRIDDGEYPYGTGQYWANPSITKAAQRMREIFLNKPWRDRLALAGQDFIKTHHSPDVVGEKFGLELKRIRELINNGTTY